MQFDHINESKDSSYIVTNLFSENQGSSSSNVNSDISSVVNQNLPIPGPVVPIATVQQIVNPERIYGLPQLIQHGQASGLVDRRELVNLLVQSARAEVSDLNQILTPDQVRNLVRGEYNEAYPVYMGLAREIIITNDPLAQDYGHTEWLRSRRA